MKGEACWLLRSALIRRAASRRLLHWFWAPCSSFHTEIRSSRSGSAPPPRHRSLQESCQVAKTSTRLVHQVAGISIRVGRPGSVDLLPVSPLDSGDLVPVGPPGSGDLHTADHQDGFTGGGAIADPLCPPAGSAYAVCCCSSLALYSLSSGP